MSWAEFQIRIIGFKRQREYEASLTREISYEVHKLNYLFGKRKPPNKQAFWPIGEQQQKKGVTKELKEFFLKSREQYKAKKNG